MFDADPRQAAFVLVHRETGEKRALESSEVAYPYSALPASLLFAVIRGYCRSGYLAGDWSARSSGLSSI